jgi:hypothetical protein
MSFPEVVSVRPAAVRLPKGEDREKFPKRPWLLFCSCFGFGHGFLIVIIGNKRT